MSPQAVSAHVAPHSKHIRWPHQRDNTPLRQHGLALLLGVILPLLLSLLTTASSPGTGLLAFVAIVAGFGLVGAGALLYGWWMHAARPATDEEPGAPPWRLGAGPTAFSRHPQWLALVAWVLGLALFAPTLWALGYVLLLVVGLNLLVQRHDEPKLRQDFGNDYDRYAEGVPRWLPWGSMMKTLREIGEVLRNTIRPR